MFVLVSEDQVSSFMPAVVALITIVPAVLAAYWAKGARSDSKQAKQNSADAAESATLAAAEVMSNGGMSDPNPNLNDHVKYQTEKLDSIESRLDGLGEAFVTHLNQADVMFQALAELYLERRGIPLQDPSKPKPDDN